MDHFQKLNEPLRREIDKLKKRRDNLNTELSQADGNIEKLKETLGSEMLDERDTGKTSDALLRAGLKIDALKEAIAQANKRISDLEFECQENEKKFGWTEFNRLEAEAAERLSVCITRLHQDVAELDAIESLYTQMSTVGHGTSMEFLSDDQRQTRTVLTWLQGDVRDSENFVNKVKRVEQDHSRAIARMRAIKSR